MLLAVDPAHAFTLQGFNHDWAATESYCNMSDLAESCTPQGVSNDTRDGAFALGPLTQFGVVDSARPATPSQVPPFGSDGLTLSHGSALLRAEFPATAILSMYAHTEVLDGLDVDTDWYTIAPDAGLCVEICMLPRGTAGRATVQDDWQLDVYLGEETSPLFEQIGPGCLDWYSDGSSLALRVSDPTPELVLLTAATLAHQHYRLRIGNPDGNQGATWFPDADGDGLGDSAASGVFACAPPVPGWVDNALDCGDDDAYIRPGAVERCNGRDDDCNGTPDDTTVTFAWYPDADLDGYGAIGGTPVYACGSPGVGYAPNATDCDDAASAVHPLAVETCNGVDDDCDGLIDDQVAWATYWPDTDGDGYGDPLGEVRSACADPGEGWADNPRDCDDSSDAVYPGAPEACNGVDNDCDGVPDSGVKQASWWPDADGDGQGDADATPVFGCAPPEPTGFVDNDLDCDDTRDDVYLGAPEVCDGVDRSCSGVADDGGVLLTFYRDEDGDGAGDPDAATQACASPGDGWVTVAGDCDDDDGARHPGAEEACDGVDNDCDGYADEGCFELPPPPGACGCSVPGAPGWGLALWVPLLMMRRRRGGVA